jgi:FMN phosphatase YigB (HAD superfamily)
MDVGGVIYHDYPFRIAWLHDIYETIRTREGRVAESFLQCMASGPDREWLDSLATTAFGSEWSAVSDECWMRVRRRWLDLVHPCCGAISAVRRLGQQYRLATVANQPPECLDALRHLGMADEFEYHLLDSVVGVSKPNRQFLRLAVQRAGVDKQSVLVVGDRMDNDLEPAAAEGIATAWINGAPPRAIIHDIAGVPPGFVQLWVNGSLRCPRGPRSEVRRVSGAIRPMFVSTSLAQLADLIAGAPSDPVDPR